MPREAGFQAQAALRHILHGHGGSSLSSTVLPFNRMTAQRHSQGESNRLDAWRDAQNGGAWKEAETGSSGSSCLCLVQCSTAHTVSRCFAFGYN